MRLRKSYYFRMKTSQYLLTGLLLLMIHACKIIRKADFIVFNAKVMTMDSLNSLSEAFAIKDGRFLAVGKNEEIKSRYTSNSAIDLKGKFVYPGLIDAHCHFYEYGLSLQWADLHGIQSFEEIVEVLKGHHKKYPGEWILGRGWDQN